MYQIILHAMITTTQKERIKSNSKWFMLEVFKKIGPLNKNKLESHHWFDKFIFTHKC